MTDVLEVEDHSSNTNLDDVFNGSDDILEQSFAKEKSFEPEGDKAEVKETEDDAEPPSAEEDNDHDEKSVPVAALKSERQKRQAAEARILELEQKLAPKTDDESDKDDISQMLFAERTNMSRQMMIDSTADYEQMEEIFTKIAEQNPALVQEMTKSPHPAKYAYTKAKEHLELEELKKARSSSEWSEFQKWKEEQKSKPKQDSDPAELRKKSALSVPNLNKMTSVSTNTVAREKIPTLSDIFD